MYNLIGSGALTAHDVSKVDMSQDMRQKRMEYQFLSSSMNWRIYGLSNNCTAQMGNEL